MNGSRRLVIAVVMAALLGIAAPVAQANITLSQAGGTLFIDGGSGIERVSVAQGSGAAVIGVTDLDGHSITLGGGNCVFPVQTDHHKANCGSSNTLLSVDLGAGHDQLLVSDSDTP